MCPKTPRCEAVCRVVCRHMSQDVPLSSRSKPLPRVARVHVSTWGDGAAHAHIFFLARPPRMPQLRGTMLAVWGDFLPPIPGDVRDANARAVIQDLVRPYGGGALGRAA